MLEEEIAHGLLASASGPPHGLLELFEAIAVHVNSLRVEALLVPLPAVPFLLNLVFDSLLLLSLLSDLHPLLLLSFLDASGHGLISFLQLVVFLFSELAYCGLLFFLCPHLLLHAISEVFLFLSNLFLCPVLEWQPLISPETRPPE